MAANKKIEEALDHIKAAEKRLEMKFYICFLYWSMTIWDLLDEHSLRYKVTLSQLTENIRLTYEV